MDTNPRGSSVLTSIAQRLISFITPRQLLRSARMLASFIALAVFGFYAAASVTSLWHNPPPAQTITVALAPPNVEPVALPLEAIEPAAGTPADDDFIRPIRKPSLTRNIDLTADTLEGHGFLSLVLPET